MERKKPQPAELKKAKAELDKIISVESVKQRHRRAIEATLRDLRILGYYCSYPATKEFKKVFDISAESPYLDRSKDVGSFIKVCIDSVSKVDIKAIEDFKTSKKKSLWIRITGGKIAVFFWEGKNLIWELDEAPLSKFIKTGVVQKSEEVCQSDEGKVKDMKESAVVAK